MKKKVEINIFGTCICRDIFGMQPDDGGVDIKKFIQDISPITVGISDSFPNSFEEVDSILSQHELHNFWKRNFILDYTGESIKYLNQSNVDYLILDMGCCRYDLYKFEDDHILTKMYNNQKEQRELIRLVASELNNSSSYGTISDNSVLIMLMDKYLPAFFEKIKSLYTVDQIILIETDIVDFKISNEGVLIQNPHREVLQNWKIRIEYANKLAKKYLCGCHMVEFPRWIVSDEKHKWGPSALHYIKQYYDYAFTCIRIIFQKYSIYDEILLLRIEKEKIEQENYPLFYEALQKAIDVNEKKLIEYRNINQRLMKYCDYFRGLFAEENRLDHIVNYLREYNYISIGIYGLSQVGIFLIDFLEKNEFDIKFIVENGTRSLYKGYIPRYLRKDFEKFPEVDVMIIADFMQTEYIKQLLTNHIKTPIVDVYDIV